MTSGPGLAAAPAEAAGRDAAVTYAVIGNTTVAGTATVPEGTATVPVDPGSGPGGPATVPVDPVTDRVPVAVIPRPAGRALPGSASFRSRQRGYDRVQVDNYVAWAETELAVTRRQVDDLVVRLGACAAELETARRDAATRDRSGLPAPIVDLLRCAADDARRLTDEAAAEAERILADARLEADARVRKADAIVEAATAAAAEQLATAEREVAELRRQRDDARASLHRLTARIGEALQGAIPLPDGGTRSPERPHAGS